MRYELNEIWYDMIGYKCECEGECNIIWMQYNMNMI